VVAQQRRLSAVVTFETEDETVLFTAPAGYIVQWSLVNVVEDRLATDLAAQTLQPLPRQLHSPHQLA